MRKFSLCFFVLFIFLCISGSVLAGVDNVKIIVYKTYDHTQYSYGFFQKCGETATIGIAFTNNNSKDYTVAFPKTGKIHTNGTTHNIKNLRWNDTVTPETTSLTYVDHSKDKAFKNSIVIPAKKTGAVFFDIDNMTPYNLWNDTQFYYSITISGEGKSTTKEIEANLYQRGNGCPADQVCSAKIVSGSYTAKGGGSVTVNVKNNMPDWTYVTALTDVDVLVPGQTEAITVKNGITWTKQPGSMGSGSSVNINGKLKLPSDIASKNKSLTITFHFYHPSSLNFGNFTAAGKLSVSDGLQGVMSGSFGVNGKGTFKATLNNNTKKAVTVTLPARGRLSDSSGNSVSVKYTWNNTTGVKNNTVTIPAKGSVNLSGKFSFSNKSLVASNSSLILTADFDGGTAKGSTSGSVTRKADPNPVVKSVSFCRNYKEGSKKMTFIYQLKSEANTDILVELATTLKVPGNQWNPQITYTKCVSGGSSCMNRISGYNFVIKAGERVKFTGQVTLDVPGSSSLSAQTSLRYFADGKTYALYVGKTAKSCSSPAPVDPTITPEPTVTPIPVETGDLSTVSFCRTLQNKNVVFQYTLKNETKNKIKIELAQTLAVQGFDKVIPIKYTGCENIGGSACKISGKTHTIGAGKSVQFNATATLPKAPASSNFSIRTSLIYYTTGGETKAYFIGRTGSKCAVTPVTPVPTDAVIKSTGFCRGGVSGGKLSFSYVLTNPNDIAIPVQLAKTLKVEGQPKNLTITYEKVKGLKDYDYTLKAKESVMFNGEVTLETKTLPANYYVYTSLVYYANGIRKVLDLGETRSACAAGKDAALEMDDEEELPAAELTASINNGTYGSCGNADQLRFTLDITNSGMGNGYVDLSAFSLWVGGTSVPFTAESCAVKSVSGVDTQSCAAEMKSRVFTVNPNVTLSLDLSANRKAAGENVTAEFDIPDIAPELIEFEPVADTSVCEPKVTVVSGPDGKAVQANVTVKKDAVDLSIQFTNSGDADAFVTPGPVYFPRDVLERYSGVVQYESLDGSGITKDVEQFSSKKSILIPAQSFASFTIGMDVNLAEAFSSTADLTWHFDLQGTPVNYAGTVDFAQKSNTVIEKSVLTDTDDGGAMSTLHFYNIGTPVMPERLPATGFPTNGLHVVTAQPADLKYKDLNGLHLEIPVIDAVMDLVQVPLDENNEWAVEWLGNRGGILSSGALPGKGTSVIAAHNHLDEMHAGPFDLLQKLDEKDRIFVTDAKGSVQTYSVYANELVKPDDAEKLYERSIPGSLVLVTCESEMPEGGYAFRRIVYAEPLQ